MSRPTILSLVLLLLAGTARAQAPEGEAVGKAYPDFVLPDLDGKLVRLSDFRGKKVLLFHFASW